MKNISMSKLMIILDELLITLELNSHSNMEQFIQVISRDKNWDELIKEIFPTLNTIEIENLMKLIKLLYDTTQNSEHVEFVTTIPTDIDTRLRKTIAVVRELIIESKTKILITGYSVSDFVDEIIDLLIYKSNQGVRVQFFIDKNIKLKNFFDKRLRNSNIELYRYKFNESFSSLHAKVILTDSKKAFVTSSNLSYNGIVNNVEIGTLVTGKKVTQIEELFISLINNDFFDKVT